MLAGERSNPVGRGWESPLLTVVRPRASQNRCRPPPGALRRVASREAGEPLFHPDLRSPLNGVLAQGSKRTRPPRHGSGDGTGLRPPPPDGRWGDLQDVLPHALARGWLPPTARPAGRRSQRHRVRSAHDNSASAHGTGFCISTLSWERQANTPRTHQKHT